MRIKTVSLSLALLLTPILGCQTDSRQQILATDRSQVALRSIQSRVYNTSDQKLTIRTIIATLQDLGFTVDKVDHEIGVVSATKAGNYLMKMTVSSRQRSGNQMYVRASVQYNLNATSDPAFYQRFFDALAQAMFLENNKIN
jgi:hypothetical protein